MQRTRNVSHIEVRELCKVLKLTVAQLDQNAGKLEAGLTMTWHGFRSMASTRLNEATEGGRKLWESDWIERQLAHVDDSVRGDYNAAEYLSDRRRMMQWWSDYLDGLRTAGKAEPLLRVA